jgi:hypothetical protein
MKRIEIVMFISVFSLVAGGTFLTADNGYVTQAMSRAALAQSALATVPAGKAIITSGGVVARAGNMLINGCVITASTDKATYQSGDKVAITISAKNPDIAVKKVEFCVKVQTYTYELDSRMPRPARTTTLSENWVSLELKPGEQKTTLVVLDGFKANPESDNTFLVYAFDKQSASNQTSDLADQLQELQNAKESLDVRQRPAAVGNQAKQAQVMKRQFTADEAQRMLLGKDSSKLLCRFNVFDAPKSNVPAYVISKPPTNASR